jgi:Fe-S-cluster containining protein
VSPPPQSGHYYSCKHHDEASGNCLNYADRPNMCSSFPFYGNPRKRCEYKECTWEDGRNPTIPADKWSLTRKLPRSLEAQLVSCKDVVYKDSAA